MSKDIVLETRDVKKIYNLGEGTETRAVDGIDIKIKRGEFVSIMGPSGSGKTTLLDLIGCLMKPTQGDIFVDNIDIKTLNDDKLTRMRGHKIGFIFQQYNLMPSSTALENVEIALRINGKSKGVAKTRSRELLKMVGLENRMNNKPSQLSGGEQQRVAIARALANDPSIILGDEPTGNLDTNTGKVILNLLKDLNKKKGYTIVIVTHDIRVNTYVDRIIRMTDGKVSKEKK